MTRGEKKLLPLPLNVDAPFGELVARLIAVVEQHRGAGCSILAIGEYPSGYSNMGTYVVTVQGADASRQEQDILIKWGFRITYWKRNFSSGEDVGEALYEYAECVHGQSIDPTDEQMLDFLPWYLERLRAWIEQKMKAEDDDQDDPKRLSSTILMSAVFNSGGWDEQRACRRYRCLSYILRTYGRARPVDFSLEQYLQRDPYRTIIEEIERAHQCALEQWTAWWRQSRYIDYDFPPPLPDIRHDWRRVLPSLSFSFSGGKSTTYRHVEVWGQIACCYESLPVWKQGDPDALAPGVRFLVAESGIQISCWVWPTDNVQAASASVKEIAVQLSLLLDWRQAANLSRRQMRGVWLRINEIRETQARRLHEGVGTPSVGISD